MNDVELRKEMSAQRHDFIKEYYKMATLDLDRHLKQGWQTIVVLGGGLAILSAGFDEKIAIPISVALALVAAFWGMLSVIDANYWSLRAIAFLSNVEAVYFTVEDRRFFNPYIGFHPPFKLLNSLRYMFWLSMAFAFVAMLNLAWVGAEKFSNFADITLAIKQSNIITALIWLVPLHVGAWGTLWVYNVWLKRLSDYLQFSKSSPGPGVVLSRDTIRTVNFRRDIAPNLVELDTQHSGIETLEREQATRLRYLPTIWLVPIVTTVLTCGLVLLKLQ